MCVRDANSLIHFVLYVIETCQLIDMCVFSLNLLSIFFFYFTLLFNYWAYKTFEHLDIWMATYHRFKSKIPFFKQKKVFFPESADEWEIWNWTKKKYHIFRFVCNALKIKKWRAIFLPWHLLKRNNIWIWHLIYYDTIDKIIKSKRCLRFN